MKSSYNLIVKLVWYYRRYKLAFFFNLKVYIIFKLYSMALDSYYGHFPKIFQNMTLKLYFTNFFEYIGLEVFFYWNSPLIIILFIFFILFLIIFFYTPSIIHWKDEEKLKALTEARRLQEEKNKIEKKIIKPKDYYAFRKKINKHYLFLLKHFVKKKK